MKIIVCVKRVAATDTAIKIGADGTSIDPAGVEFVSTHLVRPTGTTRRARRRSRPSCGRATQVLMLCREDCSDCR